MCNSDCESHPKSELSTMNGHAELTAVCSRTRKKSNVTINGADQIACTVCIKIVGGQSLYVEYSAGLGSFTCININQYQHPVPDLNFPHPPPHPLSFDTRPSYFPVTRSTSLRLVRSSGSVFRCPSTLFNPDAVTLTEGTAIMRFVFVFLIPGLAARLAHAR